MKVKFPHDIVKTNRQLIGRYQNDPSMIKDEAFLKGFAIQTLMHFKMPTNEVTNF